MNVTIACVCPPKADGTTRHEQDTVTLRDTLDFRQTLSVRQAIRLELASADASGVALSIAEITSLMAEAYLRVCIEAWTLVDDKGKPRDPSRADVEALMVEHYEEAEDIANVADSLYTDKVVLPLLTGASSSSPSTPTPEPPASPQPTSATTNGSTPRKPSKRSSTTTTQMVVTGPMAASPGGGSNSSLS